MRGSILLVLIMVMLCPSVFADGGAKQFTLDLPPNWPDAERVRLLLENVTVPANRPFKLRASVKGREGSKIVLRSVGIEATGPNRTGVRTIPSMPLDVTRPLRRFLEAAANTSSVLIVIEAVDSRGEVLNDVEWKVDRVSLKTN